jgi:di/tricarboxylate transporter
MAILSLIALVLSILLGSVFKVNIGIIAIVFTFVIGFFTDGLTIQEVVTFFPSSLFLTLLGITFFFSYAQLNGTLEKITQRIIFFFRGNVFWIPISFFLLTLCLSAVGAGNIAATALVAPAAMASAKKLKISPFLMAIMVANGANAGGLSPIAPTGIIAAERIAQIGLPNLSWVIFF